MNRRRAWRATTLGVSCILLGAGSFSGVSAAEADGATVGQSLEQVQYVEAEPDAATVRLLL